MFDIDGVFRPMGTAPDIGCDEFGNAAVVTQARTR